MPVGLDVTEVPQWNTFPEGGIGEMAVPVCVCFEAETGEINKYSIQVLVADEATPRLLCMGSQTVERRVQPRNVKRIAHQDGVAVE